MYGKAHLLTERIIDKANTNENETGPMVYEIA